MNSDKLNLLAEYEGHASPSDMFESIGLVDSVPAICMSVPAICMNPGCDYTTEYEPDITNGWCECCNTRSMKSAFVLAGFI